MDLNSFKEFIKQLDPEKRKVANIWQTAIGLQAVDGLTVSEMLLDVAVQHISGEITMEEATKIIEEHYS